MKVEMINLNKLSRHADKITRFLLEKQELPKHEAFATVAMCLYSICGFDKERTGYNFNQLLNQLDSATHGEPEGPLNR